MKIGIVMDPIAKINRKKDSTYTMILEAEKRGHVIYYMEQGDLFMRDGIVKANIAKLVLFPKESEWFKLFDKTCLPLNELDVILMRKDPPFDTEYIYTTYLLEHAEKLGTWVINRPQSLRDANEKLFTAWVPQCCPSTLVSRNKFAIKEFLEEINDIILKPLDGMGGASVFRIQKGDLNTNVIIETLTQYETKYVMAQHFLPEIKDGDKRILMINGNPIPFALARIPASGELRGNLTAGGTGKAIVLSERDEWICQQVGPLLQEKGLVFVGLDVIGDYLTEINVTSPTCIQELDAQCDINISADLLDFIESRTN